MTPAQLRSLCESLGRDGQTKLAKLLGVTPRTIRNKLSGATPITQMDGLAIRQAMGVTMNND